MECTLDTLARYDASGAAGAALVLAACLGLQAPRTAAQAASPHESDAPTAPLSVSVPVVPWRAGAKDLSARARCAAKPGEPPPPAEFQFDERYVLALPRESDHAADLKALVLDGLAAHFGGEGREDGLATLGDVIAALGGLSEDQQDERWEAWAKHCPKLCDALQPLVSELLSEPRKIVFFDDCEPTGECQDHWLGPGMERDDLEWTCAQSAVLAILPARGAQPSPGDAQRALDCMRRTDQDIDAPTTWSDMAYPYSRVALLAGPFADDAAGSTTVVVHYECRDGDTQTDLAFHTRPDTRLSLVTDFYSLSRLLKTSLPMPEAAPRDDVHWLAGRDTYLVVNDHLGHFVALMIVTAFGYDSNQEVGFIGDEDPQRSIRENLGPLARAAQARWDSR
ncbi:MAG TPA: hypothetical protein VFY71_17080 [Planctomycetota bacterium]|nr:hypothetical protein [Planctomycetota bacterium]